MNDRKADILIVDDTPANLRMLGGMLATQGYKSRPVPSGALALKAVESEAPDLILLDINMPGMNGYEVCEKLKADERYRDIPVIFISALGETEDKLRAFSAGGVDYVGKPFQFAEVEARISAHLNLRMLRRQLERHNAHLSELVAEQVKEISEAQHATTFAIAKMAEARDSDTGAHLQRVRRYCHTLAMRLKGVSGESIPLAARIVSIADQYDALRSPRPYKAPLPHESAVRILTEGDGRTRPEHFDPRVLGAFRATEDEFARIWGEYTSEGGPRKALAKLNREGFSPA